MDIPEITSARSDIETYCSDATLADLDALAHDIGVAKAALADLESTHARIGDKIATANDRVRLRDRLVEQKVALSGQINAAAAAAFIEEKTADVRLLESKLSKVDAELKTAATSAEAAEAALKILEQKNEKCQAMLSRLSDNLVAAERKWLVSTQNALFEVFRLRLDAMKGTVALILAAERHPSFHNRNAWNIWSRPGSDLVNQLAQAMPLKGPYNYSPKWVHVSTVDRFPGYDAAVMSLAEEIAAI